MEFHLHVNKFSPHTQWMQSRQTSKGRALIYILSRFRFHFCAKHELFSGPRIFIFIFMAQRMKSSTTIHYSTSHRPPHRTKNSQYQIWIHKYSKSSIEESCTLSFVTDAISTRHFFATSLPPLGKTMRVDHTPSLIRQKIHHMNLVHVQIFFFFDTWLLALCCWVVIFESYLYIPFDQPTLLR